MPPRNSCRHPGKSTASKSVGVITSSRCTNEETFLVQKLTRAGVRQQQHRHLRPGLPFADRLRPWPGLRHLAGTQDFDSVEQADVVIVIGANPTDGHPVFASRLKKRLRAGRQADRHRSAPHRPGEIAACRGEPSPALAARHQCRRADGAGPCDRHRGPVRRGVHPRALRLGRVRGLSEFVADPRHSPPKPPRADRRAGRGAARPRRLYATGGNGAIYYGLGVTEHSQGSTTVMAIANLAMLTGNIGRPASA
jgi:formate dehydrogenase major subunit